METTKVSIIIAAFNASDTLAKAITSALAQTHDNIEVIVVDDCSTDETLQIAQQYCESDKRVKVLQTTENGGPGAARNLAIENASGEWLAILDADDWFAQDRITTLLDVAERQHVDMVIDSYWLIDNKTGQCVATKYWKLCPLCAQIGIDASYFIRWGMGSTKPLLKMSILHAHGLMFKCDVRSGEDMLLYSQLLLAGASCQFVNKPMYFRTATATSLSRDNRIAFLSELLAVLTILDEHATDKPDHNHRISEAIAYRRKITEDALVTAQWKTWIFKSDKDAKPSILSVYKLIRHWCCRHARYSVRAF